MFSCGWQGGDELRASLMHSAVFMVGGGVGWGHQLFTAGGQIIK